MAPKKSTYAPANYGSVAEALVGLYGEKVRGAEQQMLFDRFTTSLLSDAELLAKPMVLLLGQYSAGKTTFIRYLAGRDFPGIHIGPEPTTDGFAALMDGTSPTPIPGNAATADKRRPFRALSRHGAAFLNKFCISELRCDLTKELTLIDTPGILAGSKQTMGRNYDFAEIVKWFAERSDLILLLFDAHKIDISDELKTVIESLHQHDEKMRLVLNKADALTTEEIMHVYGGTMWFLGKVFKTPEVKRSYMSSFWDKPLRNPELERFMSEERERLLADLYALPAGARTRKVNEFIKRVRKGRAHCLVFNPVWKSNFGRPTPSTRCCLRSCICSMAWQFHAIGATFSSRPCRLDGVGPHEGPHNIPQDNLTHWLISTQVQSPPEVDAVDDGQGQGQGAVAEHAPGRVPQGRAAGQRPPERLPEPLRVRADARHVRPVEAAEGVQGNPAALRGRHRAGPPRHHAALHLDAGRAAAVGVLAATRRRAARLAPQAGHVGQVAAALLRAAGGHA
jgi:GTPase SAR1 family protein